MLNKHGVEAELIPQPRGTGAMCRSLRNNELDLAVALTEGVIADIATHNDDYIKIIGTYVQSPLHWAVSVNAESSYQCIDDLRGKVFGISRFGSGSHLMTYLMASKYQWNMRTDVHFEVNGGLQDLLGGLKSNSTDAFLWETFTVKPFVNKQEIRNVGEVITPWPCFIIAANKTLLESHPEVIKDFLTCVQEGTKYFKDNEQESLEFISRECNLSNEEAKQWFDQVEFSKDSSISRSTMQKAIEILQNTGVLQQDVDIARLYAPSLTKVTD